MLACVITCVATVVGLGGQDGNPDLFNESLLRAFTFRNVGPFRMQARASTIAVPNGPPKEHLYTFYVATWTGGVFKTTNGGVTFTPVFDRQNKLTIGAVAIAPSNSKIVWVGTGDTRGARSSFPGDGVYKSADAGETWTNMGLHDSHHISRVVIHPTNPDVVYVGVMGHLYSPNEERGVFKSTDGGKTWKRSFFVNDKLGVIDLVMNPQKPDVLYAATYDMQRTPWMSRNAGPDSAIYKTVDGGGTWTKLTNGLPIGPHRQDRARYLREESGDPLRGARQRQPGCLAWHAWRMHGRSASRARGRRDVSHRQRRRELDEKSIRQRMI